jgi:crossover junction endodeoxyribonuclease RusA
MEGSPRSVNFEIEIPGRPVPKKRPRVNRETRRVWTESAPAEDAVAMYLLRWKGLFPNPEPVHVDLEFHVTMRSRADIDNLAKLVLDAAQKAGVYDNDGQVESCNAKRVFVSLPDQKTIVRMRNATAARAGE